MPDRVVDAELSNAVNDPVFEERLSGLAKFALGAAKVGAERIGPERLASQM